MQMLESYLEGEWVFGGEPFQTLVDPTTGEAVARCSARGLDRGAALRYARRRGGPALRALTFAQRAEILAGLAAAIHDHRDALIELSRTSGGTTRSDAKFDIDGASGTLQYYAYVGKQLGDDKILFDGEPEGIGRSKRFVGQHVWVPRLGVAIHINAFNFPAWGLAEKAAVALLAGMPVLCKPGTATAALTQRIAQLWVETGVLPEGAFSLLVGSAGDLLDHVGPQDCVAFTGGSQTAARIRGHQAIVAHNVRVNIEADSLNASILGADVEPGSDTFQMFVNQVVRDLSQKAGQKCTCVRRIFIPADRMDEAVAALVERLEGIRVGDPGERGIDVGPLASPAQRSSVSEGLARLEAIGTPLWRGEAPGGGCFVRPGLFRVDGGLEAELVHEHEVFGPVASVLPYQGGAEEVIALVAAGGGGLVASVYSDDPDWAGPVILGLAPWHGRIHWGSRKVHDQSPGPGTVMPNLIHGGPGKAGGGEELGGERGLHFYLQRTALQADRGLLERILS
ncbi:MAG TPA: 3,4-dehydroadipyl-CoA semialdehyde dehydrogenase [Deltaproteobacteria bacterium]|nr:3,4-dehydroadipyl-CoA semialdehyde dehydrogenase [Deltaproteobacteria bacterium]